MAAGEPLDHPEEWFYLDNQEVLQGPFSTANMRSWTQKDLLNDYLQVRTASEDSFTLFRDRKHEILSAQREKHEGDYQPNLVSFWKAIKEKEFSIVKMFLTLHPQLSEVKKEKSGYDQGMSLWHYVCLCNGTTKLIDYLLSLNPELLHQKDEKGQTGFDLVVKSRNQYVRTALYFVSKDPEFGNW
eukprot:CAMPEP_0201509582 /NCGR_PEP_ID=MMETSP0161_2-20130828/2587_1 /ASSEMBLY_ACC=CAM_ASM_000251 /TAXON_ID=180227 /ORGANISM="Neoparamoeba aestuarina, Strain SoJaBio B1-5/56/2" /LENGTH=184 /DNA_ID=CAMNT_0047904575 /DNA_START=53 /DNA_END=604 /DNA_ORIENTATION=+